MDKKKTSLIEQEAPEKNTDKAYVRVSKDGSPELPGHEKNPAPKEKGQEEKPRK